MSDEILMLITLALILAVTIVGGLLLSWKTNHPAFIAMTVALTSIFTFFGVLSLPISGGSSEGITESGLRAAIATALIVQYILLISISAFANGPANERANPISQTLIANFTVVIGIVLAFYFGSSAYVEVQKVNIDSETSVSVSK